MHKTDAEEEAASFIKKVKGILRSQDGLIYSVESEVHTSNVISPSTVGDRYAYVGVTFYNVGNPENAFPSKTWMRFGEMGAEVSTWHGSNARIEFHKSFDG
jgi:hypothetical protein